MTCQWQKSLEITKKVSSSCQYLARALLSFTLVEALGCPTRIGTSLRSSLLKLDQMVIAQTVLQDNLPLEDQPNIGQMHLQRMFVLVSRGFHVREYPRSAKLVDCYPTH